MQKATDSVIIIAVLLISMFAAYLPRAIAQDSTQNYSSLASTFISSNSTFSYTTQNLLQYPFVADGYLWIMQSHSFNGGVPRIEKCSLTTNDILASNTLSTSIYEAFTPLVIDGYVLITCIPISHGGYGGLIVLNESTLSQITIIQPSHGWGYVDVCCDYMHGKLLLGQDDNSDSNFSLQTVPLDQVTNASAYQQVEIAANPDGLGS